MAKNNHVWDTIHDLLANQCGFNTWEEYSDYLLKGKRNIESHGIDIETSLISKELRIDD